MGKSETYKNSEMGIKREEWRQRFRKDTKETMSKEKKPREEGQFHSWQRGGCS